MLRLLAELNEERVRHHGGVEPEGGRPEGGRWRRRRVVWLWRRRVRNSYVSRETAAAAPDGSLANSISLWHCSRYKTLILTIEPLGAFQRQLQPRRVDGGWAGGTQQVWRGVCATQSPSNRSNSLLGWVVGVSVGEALQKVYSKGLFCSHAMVSRRACTPHPLPFTRSPKNTCSLPPPRPLPQTRARKHDPTALTDAARTVRGRLPDRLLAHMMLTPGSFARAHARCSAARPPKSS